MALSLDRFLAIHPQIPGTSNSKACCCWGDLNMGIQHLSFVASAVDWPRRYYFRDILRYWDFLCSNCSVSKLQDICSCTTPRTSNSSSSGSASGTEWRSGEFWEDKKICRRHSFRLCRVFGLSFAKHLWFMDWHHGPWILTDFDSTLFTDVVVSQFISQSSVLLLENETHST